jgi:uncharacterized protein
MKFDEARHFILNRLSLELPKDLFYHGLHHTVDVCKSVDELAASENINGKSLVLLKTAAVFHDSGFLKQYVNNEHLAAAFAEQYLPQFDYSKEEIEIVCKIILSTKIPQIPSNHIEEIMCDADLDYLGREDFFHISESLKKEWLAYGIISSEEEFNHKQVEFFSQHNYFTKTAKETREIKKQKHLMELKKRL